MAFDGDFLTVGVPWVSLNFLGLGGYGNCCLESPKGLFFFGRT